MYNVELFKEPLEYAISLELENNVYQFQLRDKRRNENPLLAFRNRLSYLGKLRFIIIDSYTDIS